MRASLRDLFRYAKTGIPSPDMRQFDKLFALQISGVGFPVTTLTGIPPLPFRSEGSVLTEWVVAGASGGVGDKTANLWNEDYTNISTSIKYTPIFVGNTDVTLSTTCKRTQSGAAIFFLPGNVSSGTSTNTNGVWAQTGSYQEMSRTVSPIDGYVTVAFRTVSESGKECNPANAKTMLNSGSTKIPYEPYGYAAPITCNGKTQTIYLDAPLDEGDTVSMSDTGITITPAAGINTFSVGTTVQPSSVSITGHIQAAT